LGNPVRGAWGLSVIGNIAYRQADYRAARPWYLESLRIFREHRNQIGIACSCNSLGSVAFHESHFETACKLHMEALEIYSDLGLVDGITWSLERIGMLEAALGNADRAARLMGAASVLRRDLGIPLASWEQEDWDRALASLHNSLGDRFEDLWQQGREMSREQAVALAV
jgi:hypothetical protein